jgi:SAM-dependent methyltransferase
MKLTSAENRTTSSQVRRLYERYPFGKFCYGADRDRHNQPLVDFLGALSPKDLVFDVGCGTGYWLEKCRALPLPPRKLFGVELSPARCAALKGEGWETVCGDMLSLGLRDNCADVVICNGVIHHTPGPFQAFEELVRISRPGGRIFLAVYNRWNPYFWLVHRAMFPLRWAYWRWGERTLPCVFPIAKVFFQPLALLVFGRKLDDATGRALLMDQVMTPHAALFSAADLRRFAERCRCDISEPRLTSDFMMWTASFTKRG